MRILILTQKVDKNDEILGFFHGWIKELALLNKEIIVICLEKGNYDLPSNVKVLSLGKDEKLSRLQYVIRFYSFIWREHKNYDSVFVHMNKEYVLLGGLIWRMMRKKVVLWYTHYLVDIWVKLAVLLSTNVVTSHALSCNIQSSKLRVLGHGIDTDHFIKKEIAHRSSKDFISLLSLGRIAPVKNIGVLLGALSVLKKNSDSYFVNFVGSALPKDMEYKQKMVELANDLGLRDRVKWWGGAQPEKTVEFYNSNDIFVNLTQTGSFDKVILEAMASGCLVVLCNRAFESVFGSVLSPILLFKEGDQEDLAKKILGIKDFSPERQENLRQQLRNIVVNDYSLKQLVQHLNKLF